MDDPGLKVWESDATRGTVGLVTVSTLDGAFTVSEMFVAAVRAPDVPVIFGKNTPPKIPVAAVSVRTLLPVVELGANEPLTPLGKPEMERVTPPVVPQVCRTAIEVVATAPESNVRVFGDAESRNPAVVGANVLIRLFPPGLPQPVTKS
jgi:hypothetical protein